MVVCVRSLDDRAGHCSDRRISVLSEKLYKQKFRILPPTFEPGGATRRSLKCTRLILSSTINHSIMTEHQRDYIRLEHALRSLQDDMARIDLLTRRPRSKGLELLVMQKENIRIKIDGNLNHGRPPVHIDYGRDWHVASGY